MIIENIFQYLQIWGIIACMLAIEYFECYLYNFKLITSYLPTIIIYFENKRKYTIV